MSNTLKRNKALAFTGSSEAVKRTIALLWNPTMAIVPVFRSPGDWKATLEEMAGSPERVAALETLQVRNEVFDAVVHDLHATGTSNGNFFVGSHDQIPAGLKGMKLSSNTIHNLAAMRVLGLQYKEIVCVLQGSEYNNMTILHELLKIVAPDVFIVQVW